MFRELFFAGVLGIVVSGSAQAYPNPLCPPSGQSNVDQACEWGVRAKEYYLRHWYVEALNKYEAAHLFDYGNATYINQIIASSDAIVNAMNGVSFAQADALFPELQMTGAADQVAKSLYYNSWAVAAGAGAQFQGFLSTINISDWTARSTAGVQAAAGLSLSLLQNFAKLLKFTRIDLQYVAANFVGGASTVPCSVFYPLQFVYSSQAMMQLVASVSQFAGNSCINDAYRAILTQAFLAGGSPVILVDSNFKPILYASSDPTVESLSNPLPVLTARILDPKFLNAVSDSIVAAQHSDQNTDISAGDLSSTITGLTGFLAAMNVSQSDQIGFYKGLISYATSQRDIIYLRLAAAYSDRLNQIEASRKRR